MEDLKKDLAFYKQREQELKLRVEELTDFIENASLPIHWVDGEGTVIWANQAELDLLGYSKEEYIGSPISKFHADQAVLEDILRRLNGDETLDGYPATLKCKDGSIKHVLINSNVYRKDGEFIHTRCLTRDVTSLVKEEQQKADLLSELEQSEARLRMAMDSTMLGTWDYNPVSGKLIWSDECKRIYGLAPDEEVKFSLFAEHIHPDDKEFVEEAIQQAMQPADGGKYEISYRILRVGSHEVRWIKAFGKVYFNDEGRAVRFLGTVLDITDVKQAEEMSAKLAAIVQSSDDAIISKTLEGTITSWNNAAQHMFGYSEEEIIGKSVLTLIPKDRFQEEPVIIDRIRKGERVDHFETKRITKDKKIIDLSLTISPVKDSHGNIIGVSKIARDITSKKQEEVRKNDFIAIVSHELKTPLTSVKSYIQVLLAKASREDNDFTLYALRRAEMHTNKMTSMINDFLSLARLEEGKIYLDKELFELRELMEDIATDAQFLASGHTISLKACDDIFVNADKDKISQILINLLSNAIKYSPKGSTVTIGCEKKGDMVKIFVSDEGVGINSSDQKRLFERFYRVENDRMKTVSGFGIGLYLVAEILKFHDSKIEVESEVGKGSTFWFELKAEVGGLKSEV